MARASQRFLVTDVLQAFTSRDPDTLAAWLRDVPHQTDRELQLAKLSDGELRRLGEVADTDCVVELLGSISDDLAGHVVEAMDPANAARVIEALDVDDATGILREVNESVSKKILAALPAERAHLFRGLLNWPDKSAAACMVPDVLTVRPDMTVEEAIAAVRVDAHSLRCDARSSAYVYVTDSESHLLGVLSFSDLVLADLQESVTALMNDDLLSVSPLSDAEDAAQALKDFDLVAVPVVDADHRLLGIITEEAAAEIAEEEATQDAERQGGSVPLEVAYLLASPWLLWRKRVVWLLLLFVAEAYTGTVLRAFEHDLEAVVALAFFIPLLIGTGGNTGTQITTTLVRALATGQVRLRDLRAVLAKELPTGALIAATMGLAAVIRAWMLGEGREITITVALTVAAIVLWAALVASVLPLLLKKLRLDPALASAPLITTIVDGTGLMIYFGIAHLTLSQLHGL